MGYEYELTLENGEAVMLPPLPGRTEMAHKRIRRVVFELMESHKADGGCAEHYNLSVRSVNRPGLARLQHYRVRFVCGLPDGSIEPRAGTAKLVNPEKSDAEYDEHLTATIEAAADIYERMTAARSAA